MTIEGRFQIGEVAEVVGLSIRTIRHYDEMGVVEPSGRSSGGFRLYTDADIQRLRLVKQYKPMRFTLEEIQEVLALQLAAAANELSADQRSRLRTYAQAAEERCAALRDELSTAEQVAKELRRVAREPAAARAR